MTRRVIVTCVATALVAGSVAAGIAGSVRFNQSQEGVTALQVSGTGDKLLTSRIGEGVVFHLRASDAGRAAGNDGGDAQVKDGSQRVGKAGAAGGAPEASAEPLVFALRGNHPNPFRGSTVIAFELPEDRHVELSIFDVRGRRVANLVNGDVAPGRHVVAWQAKDVAAGLYFYRFRAGSFVQVRRMILMQ